MEQRNRNLAAHEVGYRHADEESARDALDHYKARLLHPVEEANEAEQEARKQAVNRIGLQIVCRGKDYLAIAREDGGQKVPVEEGKIKHDDAQNKRNRDRVAEPSVCTLRLAGAPVLRDERRHGLRERGRHQHDEGTDLLRHSDARRGDEADGIHDGEDDEERNADEQVLQRDRNADGENPADDPGVPADLLSVKRKRKRALPVIRKRSTDADQLREDRGMAAPQCPCGKPQRGEDHPRCCTHRRSAP